MTLKRVAQHAFRILLWCTAIVIAAFFVLDVLQFAGVLQHTTVVLEGSYGPFVVGEKESDALEKAEKIVSVKNIVPVPTTTTYFASVPQVPATEWKSFLSTQSAWQFNGLANLSWFWHPYYSRVTLYFENGRLKRLEHWSAPFEMP